MNVAVVLTVSERPKLISSSRLVRTSALTVTEATEMTGKLGGVPKIFAVSAEPGTPMGDQFEALAQLLSLVPFQSDAQALDPSRQTKISASKRK